MGYWKREYTERKGGKPLFQPEAKQDDGEPPAPKPEAEEDRIVRPLPAGEPAGSG